MSNPTADFPSSLHSVVDLTPLAQQVMGSTTPTHSQLEGKQEEEINAIQQKIGVGLSLPTVTGTVLTCSASGTSEWRVSTGGGGTGTLVETVYDVYMDEYGFGWTTTWTPKMVDEAIGSGTEYVDRNGSETTFAYLSDVYMNYALIPLYVCHKVDINGVIWVCGDNVSPSIESNWVNTTTKTLFATRPLYIVPTGTCSVHVHPCEAVTGITFMGDGINGIVHLDSTDRLPLEKVDVGCYGRTDSPIFVSFNSEGNCSYHTPGSIVNGLRFGSENQTYYLKLSEYDTVKMELGGGGENWQPKDGTLITMNGGYNDGADGWGNKAEFTIDGKHIRRYTLSEEEYEENISGRKYHNHQSGIEGQPTIIEGDNTTDIKSVNDIIHNGLQYEIISLVSDLSGNGVTDPTPGVVFTCVGDVGLVEGDSLIQYNRGKLKIGEGECWFYTGDDRDTLYQKDLPMSNDWIDIIPDMDNFICAYSNGNPNDIAYWTNTQNVNSIDYIHVIPYFVTFRRSGSKHLHKQIIDLQAHGDVELHHQRVFACAKYDRELSALSSLSLSVGNNIYVDGDALNINLNGGGVWSVNHRNEILSVSALTEHYICSLLGDQFTPQWYYYDYYQPRLDTRFYNSETGRAEGYVTVIDHFYQIDTAGNTDWQHYGAITGVAGEVFKCTVAEPLVGTGELNDAFNDVPVDKYAIAYIYRGIEQEDHLYTYFSNVVYDSPELAQASKTMPSVPPMVASHSMMVGRIIFKGQTTDPNECICESAFDTVFQASSNITTHNSLIGRDADNCHSQYALVSNFSTGTVDVNDITVNQSIYFGSVIENTDIGEIVVIDWTKGNKQLLTWGDQGPETYVSFIPPNGPTNLTLRIINPYADATMLYFNNVIMYSGSVIPEWSNTTGQSDILNLYYDGDTYYGGAMLNMGD